MNTASKKIFVVKFKFDDDDESFVILKAFAGHLSASQYVESEAKNWDKDYKLEKGAWIDPWNYLYKKSSNDRCQAYEIEEVEVEEDVVLPELLSIEKENLALKSENDELRKKLACVEGAVTEARRYLTMWDGGWEYDKKQILKNVHKARELLENQSIEVMKK